MITIKKLFYSNKSSHIIMEENCHIQSLASYIKLKNFYKSIQKIKPERRNYLRFRKNTLRRYKKLNCFYCGATELDPNFNNPNKKRKKATIDHYIPLSKGGSLFDIRNIRICCSKCNNTKGNLNPKDFYQKIKDEKKFKNAKFVKEFNND